MSWVITGTQKIAPDPYRSNVSLLLHGDGDNGSTTIMDSSPSPKTVTAVGNAQISTAQSKFGGASLAFDGSGDALYTSNAPHVMDADFTIEAWVYPSGSGARTIVGSYPGGVNGNWFLTVEADNTIRVYHYVIFGGIEINFYTPTAISNETWSHIAVSRLGTTTRCFINGSQEMSLNKTLFDWGISTNNLTVGGRGANTNPTTNPFNGYIDDLRITKGVARYTANFTPPTAPFPDF